MDMLLRTGLETHAISCGIFRGRLLQTILEGCSVFGINPYFHMNNTLISELRNL